MKKHERVLYAATTIIAIIAIAIAALVNVALAEEPSVNPYDQFTPIGESSSYDYGPASENWASVTKNGVVYRIHAKPGAEFLFTATLPKLIPFVAPGGTGIDFTVAPLDEDSAESFDDWVDIEEVYITEDNSVKVVFRVTTPFDIPSGSYEFWAVTEGLDPQVGTTILKIEVDKDPF